jgi:hypothetical protein
MLAALVCSLPAVFAGADKTLFKGKPGMNSDTRTSVIQALTLADPEAYFALEPAALAGLAKQVAALVQPAMSAAPARPNGPLPELRVIGAPPRVNWAAHGRFPLLIAEVRSNQREWAVASRQNRHVIVSNLSTGAVHVAPAQDRGRRMPPLQPSGSGAAPDPFNAALSSINVIQRDISPWMPREQLQGRLAVTVLDYDLPSNTVNVETTADSATSVTPPANSTRPPRRLVNMDPLVAAHAGIGVRLARAPEANSSASCRVIASLQLPRTQLKVIKGPPQGITPLLVTASLVLLQLDRPRSVVVDLAVAISADDSEIRSAFSLDLNRLAAAGDYMAYLVVGDTVAGPVPVCINGL